ncbi:hypothetical protein U14_03453 [Candidatus Moduliflexus flocculans]|uniref:N-acetyltransferase domain-containing protein n=1 Tax=Candidatus Moduliflexus flocculans TaxID=1499966 RepID=A0A081BP86_9BACT|nr:hypothetical protein U14_03453 [Candidatus Moduliflexus flocculans]
MHNVFETNRLILRRLEEDDVDELAKVLSDEESMKYYPHAFTKQEVINWIQWNIENYKQYGYGLWAVIRKEDMVFLGDCGITMQNIDNEIVPEVGFHIIKSYCRNGYASEAARGSMEYVATQYGIRKIYSYCEEHNIPSMSVMKKIGMKYEKKFERDRIIRVVYSKEFNTISPVREN